MPPLAENFWRWTTSALLAGLLAIVGISWQASRHEHEALAQVYDWRNKEQDGRLERLEVRQEDVRARLSKLENQYVYEAMTALTEVRKRLDYLESRLYRLPPKEGPP